MGDFDHFLLTQPPPAPLAVCRVSLHWTGRKAHARAFEAMIAATVISNNLPLYTYNQADVEHINKLVLRPLHPDATKSA